MGSTEGTGSAKRVGQRIGVCSWSLRPRDPAELAERVRAAGLAHVQLHLDPVRRGGAWSLERTTAALAAAGVRAVSGMMSMKGEDYTTLDSIRRTGGVRPAEHWRENLEAAHGNARVARRLGLDLVSFHAGFLPDAQDDPERAVMLARLRAIADAFAAEGVRVAFETGQERAETLQAVLADLGRDTVGINFDPANVLLYGTGEPVAALEALAPWVRQIHVKDAVASPVSGTWGEEVVAGTGEVDWQRFFGVVRARGLAVDLLIEREAGDDRLADIRAARALLERLLGAGEAREPTDAPGKRAQPE